MQLWLSLKKNAFAVISDMYQQGVSEAESKEDELGAQLAGTAGHP